MPDWARVGLQRIFAHGVPVVSAALACALGLAPTTLDGECLSLSPCVLGSVSSSMRDTVQFVQLGSPCPEHTAGESLCQFG